MHTGLYSQAYLFGVTQHLPPKPITFYRFKAPNGYQHTKRHTHANSLWAAHPLFCDNCCIQSLPFNMWIILLIRIFKHAASHSRGGKKNTDIHEELFEATAKCRKQDIPHSVGGQMEGEKRPSEQCHICCQWEGKLASPRRDPRHILLEMCSELNHPDSKPWRLEIRAASAGDLKRGLRKTSRKYIG